ncbi:MAG: PSD1 and planctomycete cytochrome C domain-containing protein [Verrucomicrobiota bacterium]
MMPSFFRHRFPVASVIGAVGLISLAASGFSSAAAESAAVATAAVSSPSPASPPLSPQVEFNRDIRPILNSQCFHCHGGVKEAGGLNLQFRDQALKAGDSGNVAILPGKPEDSEFYRRLITTDGEEHMPKKGPPLTPEQVALIKQWIAEGANWQEHWAYVPPKAPASAASIDAAVEARLKSENLSLSPEAEPRILARRAALDIIGLPPTPEELEAFLNDKTPDAWPRYIDRLLASPAYGERWATVWLDLARYADSKGYESDGFRDMWRYRDWVVDSLNADLPYDRFITDQIAGDLLPGAEATPDALIATAFHRNTQTNDEGGTDDEEFRTYAIIDRVNTTFDAIQGTTYSCIQCHGHPYDPFVHKEYYQMYAFFNTSADADRGDDSPTRKFNAAKDVPAAENLKKELAAAQDKLSQSLAKTGGRDALLAWLKSEKPEPAIPDDLKPLAQQEPKAWKDPEKEKLERAFFTAKSKESADAYAEVDRLKAWQASLPVCNLPVMRELPADKSRKSFMFLRGNWMDHGEEVKPATPQILNPWHPDWPRNRLGLAKWLTNGENPLTARVQVNRVWEQLFGVGLVETSEDFGTQGERPPYPEILDSLAVKFQSAMRWSQKRLLREILLSRVYRQSSKTTPEDLKRDPANRLLARGPRFRLSSEQIRDQALQIAGLLSRKMGGPPVMPWQPPGTWLAPYSGQDWKNADGEDGRRRGLYTFIRRSSAYPSMLTFDAPNREYCVVRRLRTNTPLQSLDLLNSPVFLDAAKGLAKRMAEAGTGPEAQITRGFTLAALRAPDWREVWTLQKLYTRVGGNLTLVANTILNMDEVLNKN